MGINTWEVYAVTLPFLLPIVFVNRLSGQIARERLGLSGEDLLIDDGGGRIGKAGGLKYSRGLLTITGCVVALGVPASSNLPSKKDCLLIRIASLAVVAFCSQVFCKHYTPAAGFTFEKNYLWHRLGFNPSTDCLAFRTVLSI